MAFRASILLYSASNTRRCALQHVLRASKSTAAASQVASDGESTKPFSEMPGDAGWPLIGAFGSISELTSGKVGKESYVYKLCAKYGPIARVYIPGFGWTVFVNSANAVETMFRAEGKYPSRSSMFEHTVTNIHKHSNWPSGLIFAHGEDWKRIRSAIGKQVIPRRVGNLTPVLCDVTEDLLNHLEETTTSNGERIEDITLIMTKWAFQNTAYFVFGENLEVYNTDKRTHQEFMEAGLEFIKQVGLIVPLPIFKYFPSIAYRKFIQATGRMRELGKQVMERKVVVLSEDIARGVVDETRAVGILEQWLIEGKLEPEDALTQACDLLSAGLDTTKNTSTFLLYELAKQPALQDQLCTEIRTVLGNKVNPSWEDLQDIPLIRYCLKEILRMYPATETNFREIETDTVMNGYQVPAGTSVLSCNSVMSYSTDYFDEPDKFIPERWNKSKEDSIHPFVSLPFGFGQRGCYGRRLAELEIYILLTKLIPRFTLSTDQDSIALFQGTVLKPNEPVPITIKERSL
ncbi:probable cytochrome P450 49a1 [Halichondria panicea]|uniref:probable cytochrome P450 49a1 n=1 Tax=Halichondria panicea TaxID=6063 RepID=UPI00312B3B0F